MGIELVLFIGLGGSIVAGCMVPNRWLPSLPNDKLMHFGAFAIMTFLALQIASGWREQALWLASLAIAGWLIECLQGRFVAGRHFCWRDVVANTAGITFVTASTWLYHAAIG